ncbi:MAG: thrombospondin type 3 repeat-containing protein, partial [Myxococcales bacterium]|nr:thrombospondin type 3 repeat-containing protein [Myxococcales bacterium]
VEAAVTYPLFYCGEPEDEPSCVPWRPVEFPDGPTADDLDGDGVPNDVDNCPMVFNPVFTTPTVTYYDEQPDEDGDDLGDVCDPCPYDAGNTCTPPSADDLDGDGIKNGVDNCPYDANANQADADQDGHGDACDDCPEPNPGLQGCATSVEAIQNPDHPNHVPEGADVFVTGLTVTALRPDGNGFFAEVGNGQPWTGIMVYTAGNAADLDIGDVVDVSGTVTEYFELTELTSPVVTITSQTQTPGELSFAATVVDPASVATNGPAAESYESMFLRVEDVSITMQNADAMDYDEFAVTGNLRIDDFLFVPLDNMCPVGSLFASIDGVLNFSFSNFKLEPRGDFDFGQADCQPYP